MIYLPDIVAEIWHDPARFTLELVLTPEDPAFHGHFEGAPVLAGVIQVGWAFSLAERKLHQCWNFRGMRSVKFQRLVLPPSSLQLHIQYLETRGMFKFRYSDDAGTCSSGGVSVVPRRPASEVRGG